MRDHSPRVLILGLGASLVIWAYHFGEGAEGKAVLAAPRDVAPVEDSASTADYSEDYAQFVALLGEYRAGDDARLLALRESAQRLAEHHEREDAPLVVDYYATLASAERAQGLADYQRFAELWSAVQSADAADWATRRAAHLAELRGFIAELAAQADFVPAGRALSLAAQIEVRALEAGMDSYELEELTQRAERDALEALAIFERAGMQTPRLEPLWLLAKLEYLAGEELNATLRFEEVLAAAEQCRVDDYRERALRGLMRLARRAGDAAEVDRLLRELASFRSPSECWPLAMQHASRLLHQDQPELAAEFLLRNRPGYAEDRASWTLLLAITRLRQGDELGARALLDRLDENDTKALLLRARLGLVAGAPSTTLELLHDDVLDELRSGDARSAHELRGAAWLALDDSARALEELRLARELAETWEARLDEQRILENSSATVLGEWAGLHTATLEARALAAAGRALEAGLVIERAQSRSWRPGGTDAPETAELTRWAENYEHGLVTWIFGADMGLAVYVSPEGSAHAQTIEHTREEVTRAVRRFREATLAGDLDGMERIGEELALSLLPVELRERLETASESDARLLLVAHGAIEVLPFEALAWSGVSLDERAACLVLPELPARLPGARSTAELRWSLLGDPLAAEGAARLSEAALELDEVQSLWPNSERASAASFTRKALQRALESGRAVHVATHLASDAICDSRRFSAVGLELNAGETFCASELAQLELATPLVVLSACDTAGGRFLDGRGRQGVARALLDGGVRDLLVTLWPVSDEAARAFTPRFHAGLLEGLAPSRAAHRARVELAREGAAAAGWAAFRIAGRD